MSGYPGWRDWKGPAHENAATERLVRESGAKYRNHKTEVDGIVFDSKREAQRWQDLTLWQRAGMISELERQVSYDLVVNAQKICRYIPDFRYRNSDGVLVVEDAKGMRTKDYIIKKKLMKACHNIDVVEV